MFGTSSLGSCFISVMSTSLGAPVFGGNTLLSLAGLSLAGQLGNAGAAVAPALALAHMGTGEILVVGSCLGSAVGHGRPLEAVIAMFIFCAWCPCPLHAS